MPRAVGTGTATDDERVRYLIETGSDDLPDVLYALSSTVAVELTGDGVWRPISNSEPPWMVEYEMMSNSVGALVSAGEAEKIAKSWGAGHWGGGDWNGENGEPGTIVIWD